QRDGQVAALHRRRHFRRHGGLSRHVGSCLPLRGAGEVLATAIVRAGGRDVLPPTTPDTKTVGESMKTKFDRPGVWAIALCAVALAGCDAVKDVRSEPATELPAQKVALTGVINGLGGGRGITMRY